MRGTVGILESTTSRTTFAWFFGFRCRLGGWCFGFRCVRLGGWCFGWGGRFVGCMTRSGGGLITPTGQFGSIIILRRWNDRLGSLLQFFFHHYHRRFLDGFGGRCFFRRHHRGLFLHLGWWSFFWGRRYLLKDLLLRGPQGKLCRARFHRNTLFGHGRKVGGGKRNLWGSAFFHGWYGNNGYRRIVQERKFSRGHLFRGSGSSGSRCFC
mmetsp:Transcript_31479/g.65728  ORF Transcript_31479/g.65728 Transcript_31479/m.65728 type:complete len:209 (-) Transcript_31479:608-1234(-)